MKISLNMILGQRPEQFLGAALMSTIWADEHVIVNTGEQDNPNLRIVEDIIPNAKVIHYSDLKKPFDFSSARNYALDNSQNEWILWQDADEVHFYKFEDIARHMTDMNYGDGIKFAFYHFILDMFHYQTVDERVILFRKEGKRWDGSVHEKVIPFAQVVNHDYRYHHYGYTKPQPEIYANWRLYWSLNEPERFKLDEYRNPDDIISDRVTVANEYNGEYPEVIEQLLMIQKRKVDNYKFL